jgi:hypothetical protein
MFETQVSRFQPKSISIQDTDIEQVAHGLTDEWDDEASENSDSDIDEDIRISEAMDIAETRFRGDQIVYGEHTDGEEFDEDWESERFEAPMKKRKLL